MALMLVAIVVIFVSFGCVGCEVCPKQCECDMADGLRRALCLHQSIVSVDVGVASGVQLYSLARNSISELDNFCFKEAGYTSLKILNLSYNLIFWIGLHAFSGLDSLVHLDLSNNRLRYLPSDLFWDTPLLESLDLSGNVFESIKNEPFLMHTKLQVLNLNNCRIKYLPERLFTRLTNLRKLDLSDNYMISINIEVLKPMRKLHRLELHSEYWRCTAELMAAEDWISNRGITYAHTCGRKLPKMSEKIIAIANSDERQDVNIDEVWVVTPTNQTLPTPTKKLTPFEKLDREFPSFQAFIIGVEIGLAVGIVATYIWLRALCECGKLTCGPPRSRRQRRRQRDADRELTSTLLWSTLLHPQLETPPSCRRQLSLPGRSAPYPAYGASLATSADPVAGDRSETPPPPYNECRINI